MLKIFHTYFPIRNLVFFIGEGLLIFLALFAGMQIRYNGLPHEQVFRYSLWFRIAVTTGVVQLSLYYHDLYSIKNAQGIFELGTRLMQAVGAACIFLAFIYFIQPALILEQGIFFVGLFFLLFFLVSWRFLYQTLCLKGILAERILLLGSGSLAGLIGAEISGNLDSGYAVAAVVDPGKDDTLARRLQADFFDEYEIMCNLAQERGLKKIIVALDEKRGRFPADTLLRCKMAGINILDGITFYEALSGKILVQGTLPSWLIFSDGFRRHTLTRVTKRLFDIAAAMAGLALLWPLMVLITLAVKWSSPGPILFCQKRTGQKGKPFTLIKFRTMCDNAEATCGAVWAAQDDPRITRIGKILRTLRLDELPQFWNVLKGEMSFVGPRPERPVFIEQLQQQLPYYGERHTVKPGITGWAQINYPYGASEQDALRKLEYDLFYVKNLSLMLDLFVVLKTVQIVLFGRGAR